MRVAPITGVPGTGFIISEVQPRQYDIDLFLKVLYEEEEQFVPNKVFFSTRLPDTGGKSDYGRFHEDDDDLWLAQGYPHPVTGERIAISGSEYLSPGNVVFARMQDASIGKMSN